MGESFEQWLLKSSSESFTFCFLNSNPACVQVTGKAVMLDEIINYVQSLQQQVEVSLH
jgi:hypothetical protein